MTGGSQLVHHRAGAAARLARRALEWTEQGLERRSRGQCGVPDGAERRHRKHGHDAGCAALGLPRHELTRMIARADAVGAAPLIEAALGEAIDELCHRGASWRLHAAREAVYEAVERRITPAVAATRESATDGRRWQWSPENGKSRGHHE